MIPTYLRPGLVLRAIRSALEQTIHEIEVIVVVDGRDAETSAAVDTIADSRVSVVVPELHLGQSGARNMAVGLARAPWVAFLMMTTSGCRESLKFNFEQQNALYSHIQS